MIWMMLSEPSIPGMMFQRVSSCGLNQERMMRLAGVALPRRAFHSATIWAT